MENYISKIRRTVSIFMCCAMSCTVLADTLSTWEVGYPNPKDVVAVYQNGKLTISGKGDMIDWTRYYFGTVSPIECFTTPWVGNSLITSIVINDGVTSIGECAFVNLRNLESISIAGSVGRIGWIAFQNCSKLTTLSIPEGVTNISSYAFTGCSGVTSVSLPASLIAIGNDAFQYCSAIKSVTVPDCVSNIGTLLSWSNSSVEHVTVRNGRTTIPASMFSSRSSLRTVTLPESITVIEDAAFDGCSSLTSVKIPSNVKSIGWCSFRGCSSLTELQIPEGVTNISTYTFAGCSGLTSVKLPFGLQSIGEGAFEKCYGIRSIELSHCGAGVRNVFTYMYTSITNAVVYPGTDKIDDNLFAGCSGLQRVVIPNTIKEIGSCAFQGCGALAVIEIPAGTTNLGSYSFSGSGLVSLEIPGSVTNIGDHSCFDCTGLRSVLIHPGVICIGDWAFGFSHGCDTLQEVVIPNTVISIGSSAFYKSSGIESVVIPTCVTSLGSTFSWSNPTNVVMHEGRSEIPDGMFSGSAITSLKIPSTVKSIAAGAFWACGLLSLDIPEGVTNIGNAFYDCRGLTSISIPSSVVQYGSCPWEHCCGLKYVITNGGDKNKLDTALRGSWWVDFDSLIFIDNGQMRTWSEKYPTFADSYGTEMATTILKPTGKLSSDGTALTVWDEYVSGTDPTDENSNFTATLTMENGEPKITWTPDLSEDQVPRVYTTYGCETIGGDWKDMSTVAETDKHNYHFFKVSVKMK